MAGSERTTGGDAVEGVDPGGTHSTKPGHRGPNGTPVTKQTVESQDQNVHPQRNTQKD